MNLKKNLEKSVNDIVKAFEKKQELYFEFFVSDDVTGVACFSNEYYIHLSDVCHDIFTEQPKGLIVQWQDESIENENETINYQSYCMGLRFDMVEKYSEMKQSKKQSAIETSTNIILGLVTSFIIQLFIYPLLNIEVSINENIIITIVFFIASFLRGYFVRRLFNNYVISKNERSKNNVVYRDLRMFNIIKYKYW